MRIGIALAGGLLMAGAAGAERSALWGEGGAGWSPASRLPDFSYAGYRFGEQPLPDPRDGASVKEFGASGDGKTDDTEAFKKAVASGEGVVFIPPGRYVITDIIEIGRSNLVLRGAGPGQTTLFFPKALNAARENWGKTTDGRRTSNYSWSGGFLWARGSFGSGTLARITGPARYAENRLAVSSTDGITAGQLVEVYQRDTDENTLATHLYDGQPGDVSNLNGRVWASLVSRVAAVEGGAIVLERPLRFDVRAEWRPEIRRFEPTVTEVGVEGIRFEFPETPYQGHFTELGFNPVAFNGCAHSWIRNVEVHNADSGPYLSGSAFCTIDGIVFTSDRKRDPGRRSTGHHGVTMTGGDNLLVNFDFRTKFIHDVTFSRGSAGNVCKNGRGEDVTFDHHRFAPYANLMCNVDVGEGRELFHCGGGRALGVHCAARGTFWNIRAAVPQTHPGRNFAPDLTNFVGLTTDAPSRTDPDGAWWESIEPERLEPQDLHAAQLARRLAAAE